VLLSEARKINEKYLIMPSKSASVETQQNFWNEVDNLMHAKGKEAKANLPKPNAIPPNIACRATKTLNILGTHGGILK